MNPKKRTSNIQKYCSKHGLFAGYQWCGHRRACKAKEVTQAQWYASLKPFDTVGKKIDEMVEKSLNQIGPKPKEETPVSATVKLIHGLRDNIFDLDSEISRLSALVKGAEEKLTSLKVEREKIREAVKSIQK
jgi:hypothetical protein